MKVWQVIAIILLIIVVILVILYFYGRRMQKKQAETEMQLEAMRQTVSMLIIDKKQLRISKSGLPQTVIEQTPRHLRWTKIPIVKAKVGPKIMILAAEKEVWDVLPVKQEVKVELSGIYITKIKSVRGGRIPAPPKKKTMKERVTGLFSKKEEEPENTKGKKKK